MKSNSNTAQKCVTKDIWDRWCRLAESNRLYANHRACYLVSRL